MLISWIVLLIFGVGLNLYFVHWPTQWPMQWLPNDLRAGPSPYGEEWPQEFLDYEIPEICKCTFMYEWFGVVEIFDVGLEIPDEPELGYESSSWTRHELILIEWGKPFVVHTRRTEGTYSGDRVIDEVVVARYHLLGLILNPIIYAVPMWVLLLLISTGVGSLVRRSRRRKGACSRCGYNIQGLPKCPECGAESSPSATIQA